MPRLVTTNMSINNGDVQRRYYYFGEHCKETRPDIIAVQEVSADEGHTALQGLAKALGPDYKLHYERVYPGQEDTQGVGVVTRIPGNSKVFETEHGRNKFQILNLDVRGYRHLALANVHMEAHWLLDFKRRQKLKALISQLHPEAPQLIVGDFNAIPHLPSMRLMRRNYRSAYHDVHGREPSHTYPTDLGELLVLDNGDATPFEIWLMKLGAKLFQAANRRPSGLPRMVIDYTYVNSLIRVNDAQITGHDEVDLAHSDHRGLEVDFAVV